MQPKLTIGDRVITTRNDGEIGTVTAIRNLHGRYHAKVSIEDGDVWINTDYLTVEPIDENQLSGSSEALECEV